MKLQKQDLDAMLDTIVKVATLEDEVTRVAKEIIKLGSPIMEDKDGEHPQAFWVDALGTLAQAKLLLKEFTDKGAMFGVGVAKAMGVEIPAEFAHLEKKFQEKYDTAKNATPTVPGTDTVQ